MKNTKKIKVATMTFHIAHNYGAMLQAFALEHAVNQMGFSCEVLDYRFPYIDQWSGLRSLHDLFQECGLIGVAKYFWRGLRGDYRAIAPARRKFDRFMRKDIKLSRKVYFSAEEIRTAKYDTVLFGSDQIWNPELTNGPALEYMGQYFDPEQTNLVSYAASCGTNRIMDQWSETFLPLLKRFKALGIREKGLTEYIRSHFGLDAQTVLDPVFLPDVEAWNRLADKADISEEQPYLLIYAFECSEDVYDLAKRIAADRGLKILSIVYKKEDRGDDIVQLADCGPKDFLNLIRNAQFVCTTSFHGMAFSLVFEKDFYCFGHPKYSQRNADLLALVGMGARLLVSHDPSMTIINCDYTLAREKLNELRRESKEFLKNAIESH